MRGAARWPVRGCRALAGVLLFAPLLLTNCASTFVDCSKTAPTDTIVGRLAARHGSTATFAIESVTPLSTAAGSGAVPPVLTPGQSVDVEYYNDHARFLHIGSRYRVEIYWESGTFTSDVHTASDACSGGTVYADGRAIDTATWARSHLTELFAAFAAVPLLALVVLATVIRLRRRARITMSRR